MEAFPNVPVSEPPLLQLERLGLRETGTERQLEWVALRKAGAICPIVTPRRVS